MNSTSPLAPHSRPLEVIRAVQWSPDGDAVRIIDQRALPARLEERDLRTLDEVCDAISTLAVRGAPAIGVAGALGLVASLVPYAGEPLIEFARRAGAGASRIVGTRPTAVNLAWALGRTLTALRSAASGGVADSRTLLAAMRTEATSILEDDRERCQRIGEHGLALLHDGARVLTHCNAGALATAGIGTALAPVYLAAAAGLRVHVWVDETRPLLQGSRLTAWELQRAGIEVTVIADDMAASLMRAGQIDLCLVGADRIAANGDVANKIGTYGIAVAAQHHGIPFYVAAPWSTFDAATPSGEEIVVEQRDPAEMVCGFGVRTAPEGVGVHNPAFDVTPASLVTAIVSDRGIHRPPFRFGAGDEGSGRSATKNDVAKAAAP